MIETFARVRETIEYRIRVIPQAGDRIEDAPQRVADFGPDLDDIRERAGDFGADVIDHRIELVGEERA